MQIFYTPDIAANPELPEEEAGHCIRVLRLTEGDEILLTDGKGVFYKAAISRAHHKHCEVSILESWQQPALWNFRLPYRSCSDKKYGSDGMVCRESDRDRY